MRTRSRTAASRGSGRASSPAAARGRQGHEHSPQAEFILNSAGGSPPRMSPVIMRAAQGAGTRRQSQGARIDALTEQVAGLAEQLSAFAATFQQALAAPRPQSVPTVATESGSITSPSASPQIGSHEGAFEYRSSIGQIRGFSGADSGFVGAGAILSQVPPQVLGPRVSGGAVLNRTVGAPESQGLQGATAGLAGQALQGAIGGTAGLSTELDPSAAASTGPPAPASARAPPAVAPAPGVHATAAAAARAASPPAAGPSVVLAARDDSEFLRKFTETGRQLCSPTFCMGISLIHFVWGFLSYILYGDFSHTFCMGLYRPRSLLQAPFPFPRSTRWPSGLSNVLLPYGQSTCGQPFIT